MTIRVLLVDDQDAVRRLTRLWVEDDPRFEVVGEAGDGLTAIDVAQAEQPDVVLLDVAMPRMDGLAAVPFLRSVAPEVVIVVYTNHSEQASAALERGAAAVYTKLEPMTVVLDGVARLLAR